MGEDMIARDRGPSALLAPVLAPLLALALVGCGGDDSSQDASSDASAAPDEVSEAVASLDLSCEFEPHDNPGLIGVGTVTVLGTNTTEVRIDSMVVEMELEGTGGDLAANTSMSYVMPGEELAQWAPVFQDQEAGGGSGEYDGEVTGCSVTRVSGGRYAGDPVIDPESVTCEVFGEPGDWTLEADLSQAPEAPFEDDKFVGVLARVDGKRYSMEETELPAGELDVQVRSNSQEEPTCLVRFVRDL